MLRQQSLPVGRIVAPLFELSVEKTNLEAMRSEWIPLHREVSPEPTDCPCGQHGIVELCWIQNIRNNRRVFVGNCCVNFVAEKGYCAKCRLYPCISHTSHFCGACARNRKDAPTGVVQKGRPLYGDPIVGLTYEQAYRRNPQYAHYIRTTASCWKYNDPHYLEYLRLTHERNTPRKEAPPTMRTKRMEEYVELE